MEMTDGGEGGCKHGSKEAWVVVAESETWKRSEDWKKWRRQGGVAGGAFAQCWKYGVAGSICVYVAA